MLYCVRLFRERGAETINLAGEIAGIYTKKGNGPHGFVLSNGTYTSVDFPTATGTWVYGLNDLGEIVGTWTDTAGNIHGFYAVPQ